MGGIDLNIVMLVVVAVTNLITAALVLIAKSDIKKIELATNSMKDALVLATAKASLAEGKEAGRLGEVNRSKGDSQ